MAIKLKPAKQLCFQILHQALPPHVSFVIWLDTLTQTTKRRGKHRTLGVRSFTGVTLGRSLIKALKNDLHNERNVVSPGRPHDDKQDGWAVGVGRTEQLHNCKDGSLVAAASARQTTVAPRLRHARGFIRSGSLPSSQSACSARGAS